VTIASSEGASLPDCLRANQLHGKGGLRVAPFHADTAGMSRTGPRLNVERRQALNLLASRRSGINEELLVGGHRFSRRMLAGLVSTGLATAERQRLKANDKTIEVVRFRITRAGSRAIEGR